MQVPTVGNQFGINIALIDQVVAGSTLFSAKRSWRSSMNSPSGSVAAVVVTSRIRWGCSASHPSVQCTLYPTHPVCFFLTFACLGIIGGLNEPRCWRKFLIGSPWRPVLARMILLDPDPSQEIYRWYFL